MVQAIGVDIGGSNLRVARIAPDGRLSGRASAAVSRVPEAAVAQILERCHELDDPSVSSVGIGIPGRVDVTRRKILSGGYVDLAGTNLVARLEAALGKPVAVGNDCSMALAAEMTLGAAQGHRNVVMFTIGTGIGGAVAMGGQVVHGAGTAGQLGHITVAQGGPPCNCGRCGCVETLSSGTALGLPDALNLQKQFPDRFHYVYFSEALPGIGDEHFYANQTTLDNHPAIVRALVREQLLAQRFLYDNPTKAMDHVKIHLPGVESDAVIQEFIKQRIWYANGGLAGPGVALVQ